MLRWPFMMLPLIALFATADTVPSVAHGMSDEPAVRISRETTFLVEPIGEKGVPDYLGAINRDAGAGVTPGENAAVLLRRALGFDEMSASARVRYVKLLGVDVLVEKSARFIDWAGPGLDSEQARCDYEAALRRPWLKGNYPIVYAWLKDCETSLDIAVQASRQEQYFDPLVNDPKFDDCLVLSARGVIKALTARALLRCGEGDVAGACADLVACHHLMSLGRHVSTLGQLQFFPMPYVFRASQVLIHDRQLGLEELHRMLADLRKLRHESTLKKQIGFGDRCVVLQGAISDSRFRVTGTEREQALIIINKVYDRAVDALERPTYSERFDAMKKIDQDRSDEQMSKPYADLSEPERLIYWHCCPQLSFWVDFEGRYLMMKSLIEVACALEIYHRENGAFPEDLAKLVPKQLETIPKDVFDGKNLSYQRTASGYVLVSVGKNGVKDEDSAKDSDDIVIRR